jgi:hypothetical protein
MAAMFCEHSATIWSTFDFIERSMVIVIVGVGKFDM